MNLIATNAKRKSKNVPWDQRLWDEICFGILALAWGTAGNWLIRRLRPWVTTPFSSIGKQRQICLDLGLWWILGLSGKPKFTATYEKMGKHLWSPNQDWSFFSVQNAELRTLWHQKYWETSRLNLKNCATDLTDFNRGVSWTHTLVQQADCWKPSHKSKAVPQQALQKGKLVTGIRWLWVILAGGWRDIPIHQEKSDPKSEHKIVFQTSFNSRIHGNAYCLSSRQLHLAESFRGFLWAIRRTLHEIHTSLGMAQRRKSFLLCSLFIPLLSALSEAIALDMELFLILWMVAC